MSTPPDQEQLLLGDLIVERTLGEGGMGKVQLVRSKRTHERFAMKRTKFRDWAGQRNFLLELMTWYGLPRHPHLVECRFFRTLQNDETGGSEIAIFAEYVPGGSLAKWTADRKLYEGGSEKALERLLDVAIQFAWGLHTAHELGVVHQDVKPGNVLLASSFSPPSEGEDGGGVIVKVADFGLARARSSAGEGMSNAADQSTLVTGQGGTLPYCSPEQLACERLDRRTDIWSWGISILDMFRGKPNELRGPKAIVALEDYLNGRPEVRQLPPMPAGLVEILRKCFREDPAERWATMAEVTDALRHLYRKALGQNFPRPVPPVSEQNGRRVMVHDRRTTSGVQWPDPRDWLVPALQADGRDATEAETLLDSAVSRKAQVIADLIDYEEARRILECRMANGRRTVAAALAKLCNAKALVHEHVSDAPGAFALYDRAIALCDRLVQQEGWHELGNELARTYVNKASAMIDLGDARGAVALYDQAIPVFERLVPQEGRHELGNVLARTYANKAIALFDLGELRGAVALYDQAIAIRERLVQQDGRHELANELGLTYQNKANAVARLGDLRGAVPLYDQAIAVFERPVQQQGQPELGDELAPTYQLARTYQNKGIVLRHLGDLRGATALYDRAIALYERLVQQEGRLELSNELARTYENKGIALRHLGDLRGATALYDRAIAIRERLVQQEGRRELANDLAMTYQNKALALGDLEDLSGAAALLDRAIAIRERLVHQEGRWELADDLANLYENKASALADLGEIRAALLLYDRVIAVRELLVKKGRRELRGDLARTRVLRATALLRLGERELARTEAREAVAVLRDEVDNNARADLKLALEWATTALSELL